MLSPWFPSRGGNRNGDTGFLGRPSLKVVRADGYRSLCLHAACTEANSWGQRCGFAPWVLTSSTLPWHHHCRTSEKSFQWRLVLTMTAMLQQDLRARRLAARAHTSEKPHCRHWRRAFPPLTGLAAHNEVAAVMHDPLRTIPDETAVANSCLPCANYLLTPAMEQQLRLYHGSMWC